jgi:hypothetical protein
LKRNSRRDTNEPQKNEFTKGDLEGSDNHQQGLSHNSRTHEVYNDSINKMTEVAKSFTRHPRKPTGSKTAQQTDQSRWSRTFKPWNHF